LLVAGVAILSLWPAAGIADEIVAKGSTVRGTITVITAKGAEIETEFDHVKLVIPFADVQSMTTDEPFRVFYDEDSELVGRVVGGTDTTLRIGHSESDARDIEVTRIVIARPESGSGLISLRSRMRYWRGLADVGFGLTQATVDNTLVSAGLRAERNKGPTRLVIDFGGHYGTQKRQRPRPGGEEMRLADDLRGGLKGQYDIGKSFFLWASGDAKYDGIQNISYRVVPAAGVGYYLYKTETATLQIESGGFYAYERFFGGATNSLRGVAFGAEAATALPAGAALHWRMDYLPAINDWTNTYLLRNEASIISPLRGALSFKLSVLDEYDSHPARDASGQLTAKENSLVTTAGVAYAF